MSARGLSSRLVKLCKILWRAGYLNLLTSPRLLSRKGGALLLGQLHLWRLWAESQNQKASWMGDKGRGGGVAPCFCFPKIPLAAGRKSDHSRVGFCLGWGSREPAKDQEKTHASGLKINWKGILRASCWSSGNNRWVKGLGIKPISSE